MAPLATAFVRLRSDSSHLAGDVRRDATKAGAEGGAVMGREFGTAFRRVSRTLIGLGIGTFAVEAGRFAVDMADKFELSRSRLETVTKNLGGDFSTVAGQVSALDARLAAFGFTNADVEGSVASLETATKSSTKAMQDAALAADIARGRNISLEEATSILMRVETGHVAMLSRLGIQVKDASGNILTQKEALQQLAATYGGSASHFAETFAGKQQALRAELGNSAAEIGVALLPAVVDLAKVLQHDVLPAVQSSAEFFDRNRKTIEPLVGTLLKLVLAYKALKLAQKGLAALSAAKAAGIAGAAETGGVSRLGLEAFTVANPLPVLVVNNMDPGAPFPTKSPPVVPVGKVPGELPTLAALGARRFPLYGVGAQSDAKIPAISATAVAALAAATRLINMLPAAQQGQARKDLGGALSQQAGGSFLHNLFLGPKFSTVVDTKKLSGLEQGWQRLIPTLHAVNTAESTTDGTIKATTLSLHAQFKALTDHQAKALALSQGMDDLRSAVHNMAVTVVGGSRALKGNSDAALANRDALRGAVSQAENYLTTLKQHGASAHHVADVEVSLSKAIKRNADETYGDTSAVHGLLKQLGFLPGQLQTVATAFDLATGAQDVFSTHAESLAQRGIFGPSAKDKAKAAGGDLAKSVGDGYSKVVDPAIAEASKKAAEVAKAAFDKAKSKMEADFSTIKSFFAQQRETIISGFANFDTSARSDLLGASGPPTPFLQQLNAEAKEANKFTRLWIRLDNEGLNPRLLDIFEGLGPAAIPTMQLWASHPKMRHRASRDIRQIGRDATRVGQAATEDKYGPLIHHDLVTLPKKIGDEFRHKVQVTLDTKSLDRLEGRRVQFS